MKYKFISREQTKKDWEEGRVQCEYNGDLKKLIQLINIVSKECGAKGTDKYYFINKYKNWYSSKFPFENLPTATTDELYEWIYGEEQEKTTMSIVGMAHSIEQSKGMNCNVYVFHQFPKTKEIPKEKFKDICQSIEANLNEPAPQPPQEQRELLGYKLNGKRTEEQIADFLNTFPSAVRELSIKEDNKLIQLASELGVLSTCFDPVYKEREVEVILSDGIAVIKKDNVTLRYESSEWDVPITDLKKIIEAHDKL